ncbi:toll/interleukin-1 receptor domain-containing protein [Clostridium estertheticum]|uniref:toll/interleukin-1 receptor domain-containing protein n=1 Tax=Clostridium estertheticum TaxID=238834 RepID=UPI001CF26F62|nr:toll/interleukin-1 receptor domain-containing protein [Clostridium estertheticum]MCB2360294.1 toll/interleukin-1 receptor domain-containing protein [Clostridium estertheticum]
MEPKVFISHASEDKERFVIDFATKLRKRGIDAWVDKWEMSPGDSLVDKIFEEGIKNAQAVIVIISENSIKKPWVREELNAGMVKKINTGSKLIPVVIDNCEMPECLKSTVWQPIDNINSYSDELDRIIMTIFGKTDKPPIGQPPAYVNTIINIFPNLTKIDSIILKVICEKAIENNSSYNFFTDNIFEIISKYGISKYEFLETIDILDSRGYIVGTRTVNQTIPIFYLALHGINEYVNLYVKDFEIIMKRVCSCIVNKNCDNHVIASELNKPIVLINHAFDLLEQKGLIGIFKTLDGSYLLNKISPELKRMIQ